LDLTSVLFVVAMVVVGGAIGYFADVLGRNIGKKRRTLLGLRPRHTAAIFTIVAGMLIPLATTLVLFGLSSDVRVWMREGRTAVLQRDKKIEELREMTRQFNEKTRLVAQRSDEVRRLESQRRKTQSELDEQRRRLTQIRVERARLEARIRELQRSLGSIKQEYSALKGRYSELEPKYQRVSRDFTRVNAELDEAYRRNIELQLETGKREAAVRDLESKRNELQGRVDKANSELERVQTEFDRAREQYAQDIARAQSELASARSELETTKADIESLKTASGMLIANVDKARLSPMIFRFQDEIARLTVKPGSSRPEAEAALMALLRATRAEAEKRGAKGRTENEPSAGFAELTVDNKVVSPAQQAEAVVTRLVGGKDETALVAYSLWNSFVGEHVPVRVTAYPNPVVFRQGETISQADIDGRETDDRVLKQIEDLLVQKVRQRALQQRMIPVAGSQQPFGMLSSEEVLNLVELIRSTGRIVRVAAVAARETRAADQLRLEFRLR
jgi:uncharacterized protein (DUF3084 family)